MKVTDTCSICNIYTELTNEHIPPRAAFNKVPALIAKIDKANSIRQVKWKPYRSKKGSSNYTLCYKCNNKTGRWYGDSYVDFVKQCAPYAQWKYGRRTVTLSLNIFPFRVIKEALTIFCSSCGPGLSQKQNQLKKIILGQKSTGELAPLKIWLYLLAFPGGRSSGIAGIANVKKRTTRVVAEFSWWPVGWILTFDDHNIVEGLDVSDWLYKYKYRDRKRMNLYIPCNYAVTAYPLDFRHPKDVMLEAHKSMLEDKIRMIRKT